MNIIIINVIFKESKKQMRKVVDLCKAVFYYFVAQTCGKKEFACTNKTIRCVHNKKSVAYQYTILGGEMPICCTSHLYELLLFTDKILREHKIDYFIFYGTLLGAVRHKGGIIPWDSDIDCGVNRKNLDKIEQVLNLANIKYGTGYKLLRTDSHTLKLMFSELNTLHVDFFGYDVIGDDLYFEDYPNQSFVCAYSEIYPLRELELYGKKFLAPATLKPLKYYGDDWNEYYYGQYTLGKKKIRLNEEKRTPAKIDENLIRFY